MYFDLVKYLVFLISLLSILYLKIPEIKIISTFHWLDDVICFDTILPNHSH